MGVPKRRIIVLYQWKGEFILGDKNNRCPLMSTASTAWMALAFPSLYQTEDSLSPKLNPASLPQPQALLPPNQNFLSNYFKHIIHTGN